MVEVLGKHLGTRQPLRCFLHGQASALAVECQSPRHSPDRTEVICHLQRADTAVIPRW